MQSSEHGVAVCGGVDEVARALDAPHFHPLCPPPIPVRCELEHATREQALEHTPSSCLVVVSLAPQAYDGDVVVARDGRECLETGVEEQILGGSARATQSQLLRQRRPIIPDGEMLQAHGSPIPHCVARIHIVSDEAPPTDVFAESPACVGQAHVALEHRAVQPLLQSAQARAVALYTPASHHGVVLRQQPQHGHRQAPAHVPGRVICNREIELGVARSFKAVCKLAGWTHTKQTAGEPVSTNTKQQIKFRYVFHDPRAPPVA
mmetsp:Transcript_50334/g.118205  ORF Transcript_50334/g.118205 Transcript_50334/m.118205 type:complete len:263 (-) Transcript_50334:1246-2034(-)